MSPVLTFLEIVGDVEMLVFMNDSVVLVMLRLDSHRHTSSEPYPPALPSPHATDHRAMCLGGEEHLDSPAFLHRLVAFRGFLNRQFDVEHFSGGDRPSADQLDQLRQEPSNRSRAAVEGDVREEEFLDIKRDLMRHADVSNVSSRPRRRGPSLHATDCA